MSRSASSSPLRKKTRLSSPTYDDQFADLDTLDFQVLDDIETRLSQQTEPTPSLPQAPLLAFDRREKRRRAIENALRSTEASELEEQDDSGIMLTDGAELNLREPTSSAPRPSLPEGLGFTSAASLPLAIGPAANRTVPPIASAFTSASDLADSTSHQDAHTQLSPSPPNPPNLNYDDWFAPAIAPLSTGFASASAFRPAVAVEGAPLGDTTPVIGFKRASGGGWASPSAAALETAQKKLQAWQAQIDSELSTVEVDRDAAKDKQSTAVRAPLKGLENSVISAAASGFSSASTNHDSQPAPPGAFKPPTFTTPLRSNAPSRSFISNPVLARTSAAASINIPKAPIAPSSSSAPSTPVRPSTPTARRLPQTSKPPAFTTPKPSTAPHHPRTTPQKAKPLGLTPRAHAFSGSKTRPKFVTPFKQGMRPGELGREVLLQASQPKTQALVQYEGKGKGREVAVVPVAKAKTEDAGKHIFNLVKPSNRKNLANCGLTPQLYTNDELAEMGLDAGLFSLATVSHFLYYRFNPADAGLPATALTSTQASLGPDSAFEALLGMGCHLATKVWVDNHWSLILWKMIGMACLEPSTLEKTWSWNEVMRQLRYRYTRELANGSRPALRLITTQDVPSSGPLVLCVSGMFWADEHVDAEGQLVLAHPELELTDGWYRLRATVDESLARAARNKVLRVGRKIACSGARLESPKKEPMEVLDAYGSAHLILSGNSTHLAPWHAKLGFQGAPFVATLGSLSPNGGSVALMDLLVVQVYPVGFIEFITTENGELIREGPRTENDEAVEEDRWKERRSHEAGKLRDEMEKKLHKLESYADRLERIAGSGFQPTEEESSPDHIEDLAEELEDSEDPASLIKSVSKKDAGWLSLFLRKKCETDREKGGEEVDRELATSFPPRQVRNFRVLRVKDARTARKPAWRSAQLTVWDAMALNATEGGSAGSFAVGQRYMITSLIPSQPSAWMALEPGSEVYLSTRRDSKWRLIN